MADGSTRYSFEFYVLSFLNHDEHPEGELHWTRTEPITAMYSTLLYPEEMTEEPSTFQAGDPAQATSHCDGGCRLRPRPVLPVGVLDVLLLPRGKPSRVGG